MRLSSLEYSLSPEETDNKFIHLTNNAIQKFSNSYGSFEDANQLSFSDFQRFLETQNGTKDINFKNSILPRITSIICKTLISTKKKLTTENRKWTFEIFGYDFIIDNDLNPLLIEINSNPCLELSSNLLKSLIPRMINDAFKLTIDIHFPNNSTVSDSNNKVYHVQGYSDTENMFEEICNLNDFSSNKNINSNILSSNYIISISKNQSVKIKRNLHKSKIAKRNLFVHCSSC